MYITRKTIFLHTNENLHGRRRRRISVKNRIERISFYERRNYLATGSYDSYRGMMIFSLARGTLFLSHEDLRGRNFISKPRRIVFLSVYVYSEEKDFK